MTTINQGMSVEEIEWVVAQRVAKAIEAIAIYETKTNLACKSMSQTERQKEKVAENASNKRKWESNHNGSLSQQNKVHKVPRAYIAWPINKKAYAGSLPLTPATAKNQQTHTCYECGSLRHYKTSNEELEAPIEDQPLPTDASPTALLPGYIDDSNPEEDEEDPEVDPVDYPVNRGDNDDNESSDDDVEKDGEFDEEEEHLAPVDHSVLPIVDHVPSS
nr:hypothetical protein [Tanacetum cinerariifolium]